MIPLRLIRNSTFLSLSVNNYLLSLSHGFRKKCVCFLSTKSLQKHGPAFIIKKRIIDGKMKSDHRQTPVVNKLQEVYENIKNYSPKKIMSKSPKGLYIYGTVGAGKTMLMDIFYQSVQTKSKRRSHFNNFMLDVHSRVHELKKKSKSSIWGSRSHPFDPITPVARDLVKEAWLLCFDEFQVTDIADAMILKRLFTEMFDNGMIMVATSNRSPDDLYKNGLQRVNFLPFIPVLKKHCSVIAISGKDYRVSSSDSINNHYLLLNEPNTKSEMDSAFKRLCHLEKKTPESRTLDIMGHKIVFRNTCGRILYASFKELCDRPLSSADYIQIAKHFDIILIKNVPVMSLESRNQARRFILLIDTLYDKRIKVMISAEAPPKNLFSETSGNEVDEELKRMIMDDLQIEKGSENARASLFSGSEEVFAFERTVSRITEMCSNSYWAQH